MASLARLFLKHETWGYRWEAEIWRVHQSGRTGVSPLGGDLSGPVPSRRFPPLRPLTARGTRHRCKSWRSPFKSASAVRKGSSSETSRTQNRGQIRTRVPFAFCRLAGPRQRFLRRVFGCFSSPGGSFSLCSEFLGNSAQWVTVLQPTRVVKIARVYGVCIACRALF